MNLAALTIKDILKDKKPFSQHEEALELKKSELSKTWQYQ